MGGEGEGLRGLGGFFEGGAQGTEEKEEELKSDINECISPCKSAEIKEDESPFDCPHGGSGGILLRFLDALEILGRIPHCLEGGGGEKYPPREADGWNYFLV